MLLGYTVAKAPASPRNSTWFTRPFLLVRGWGLGTRLAIPRLLFAFPIIHNTQEWKAALEHSLCEWHQVDTGERGLTSKYCTWSSICVLYCFKLKILSWSKLLVLSSKKLAFKFSSYIHIWILHGLPSPTSTLCPLTWCSQAFPIFRFYVLLLM